MRIGYGYTCMNMYERQAADIAQILLISGKFEIETAQTDHSY